MHVALAGAIRAMEMSSMMILAGVFVDDHPLMMVVEVV